MSRILILFASQYGYTETYARWIAQDLGNSATGLRVQVQPIAETTAAEITAADLLVVGASDYGGSLTGAADLKKLSPACEEKTRIFFTVSFSGLDGASREKLDGIVTKNFGDLARGAEIFHFRGGLDHSRLSLKHKAVMMGIRTAIAALPHKNTANQQMLDSFDQKTVDYSDRQAIAPLIEAALARLGKG